MYPVKDHRLTERWTSGKRCPTVSSERPYGLTSTVGVCLSFVEGQWPQVELRSGPNPPEKVNPGSEEGGGGCSGWREGLVVLVVYVGTSDVRRVSCPCVPIGLNAGMSLGGPSGRVENT